MATEADKAKFNANYDKILYWDSLGISYEMNVMSYDLNNFNAYVNLVKRCGTLIALDDSEFIDMMKDDCFIGGLCGKSVPNVLVCDTIDKLISTYESRPINTIIFYPVDGDSYNCIKDFVKKVENIMKFDLVIMNPPYSGNGDPLFMKITKVMYDNCLTENGKVVSVNPTSVIDNTYGGNDDHSKALKEKYVDTLRVVDIDYNDEYSGIFGDVNIGTGICVTTYAENGTYTLHDDYIRGKRFGEKNWKMRKSIIGKVNSYIGDNYKNSIYKMNGFVGIMMSDPNQRKLKVEKVAKEIGNADMVVFAFNRGHLDKKSGFHKWDWVTLQSGDNLSVKTDVDNIQQFIVPFYNAKVDAVNLIKWSTIDAFGYFVNHYKTQLSNCSVLFKLLPCPPSTNGDYSDETLMRIFGFTKEEMDWIHSEMKDFGWKVNKGMTEAELMKHIEEINK